MFSINAAARNSPLSRAQVEEVQALLSSHIRLEPIYVETVGDRDKSTSLRTLDKTDFFTREIDEMLLAGKCRIAIHSAKDLPEPLPRGLVLAALTEGVDPSDSLILRHTLFPGAVIATSSERREEMVRQLEPKATFVDVRGTIEERLEKVARGEVDGLVVAEAALIRLKLTHLNRLRLPGETAPFQGQLAIVAREEDHEILDVLKHSFGTDSRAQVARQDP